MDGMIRIDGKVTKYYHLSSLLLYHVLSKHVPIFTFA